MLGGENRPRAGGLKWSRPVRGGGGENRFTEHLVRHLSIERGRQQIGCSYQHGASTLLYTQEQLLLQVDRLPASRGLSQRNNL